MIVGQVMRNPDGGLEARCAASVMLTSKRAC